MKRLFKRGCRKTSKQQAQIWKPEMVLLCYDHHENVKQIEINSDSDSSENESDIESANIREDHKETVQREQPTMANNDGVVRWTQKLSTLRQIFELVKNRWFICAVVVVGIGVLIAWLCL